MYIKHLIGYRTVRKPYLQAWVISMSDHIRRITLDQARKLKSLSSKQKLSELTEEDIDRIISTDPDLYQLTDEELSQFKLARSNTNENNN